MTAASNTATDPRAALARRTPFFYGWAVVTAAGSTVFVRNAAATLTIAVFVLPMSEDLGWRRFDVHLADRRMGTSEIRRTDVDERIGDIAGRRNTLAPLDYESDHFLSAVWHRSVNVPGATSDRCFDCGRTMVCAHARPLVFYARRLSLFRHGAVSAVRPAVYERE